MARGDGSADGLLYGEAPGLKHRNPEPVDGLIELGGEEMWVLIEALRLESLKSKEARPFLLRCHLLDIIGAETATVAGQYKEPLSKDLERLCQEWESMPPLIDGRRPAPIRNVLDFSAALGALQTAAGRTGGGWLNERAEALFERFEEAGDALEGYVSS